MLFSTATLITASALLSALTVASPLVANSTTSEVATIDRSDSKLFFGEIETDLTADDVIHLLQASGRITWISHGEGHYVDIPQHVWYSAINSTHKTVTKRINTRDTTIGTVAGFAASASCYTVGSVMDDSSIAGFVSDACDGLVGNSLPPLVVGALRVWQSGELPDSDGIASYVRFSTKLLTNGFKYDKSLCEQAMKNFNNYCQKRSGATNGGEIKVGKAIMFNADPTDLDCNC